MVAKNNKGQSLLEVLILLPFLFMFVGILYKITMASQMAIVNTQYARSQIYVLTANSPEYPRLQFRNDPRMFSEGKQDRMLLGVADPKALTSSTGLEGTMEAIPQTQKIARVGTSAVGSNDKGEVAKRTELRVRSTAAICTQLNELPNGSKDRWPFGTSVCRYKGMDI